ncbi:hypothetical protein PLICRDRAFT_350729 [Plicaturopsis crispa FD-325 SS-3]|uniref:Uncharacterized protein n=1 Tax=Plicaturopsis crispa FD-325 SS-3 TaxID=944288 RepID=A0A0C9SL76_PLICR|nr:hypothetical protein PLICRDRAFT_350729 [Plicaturopsis crispa FD-325 SS-3]
MASSAVASENAGIRPGSSERSKLRRDRLRQIEMEQLVEEKQALKMTEAERQTLIHSFTSVKTEFADLDGLTWNIHYTHTISHSAPPPKCSDPYYSPSAPFAVLSNAELAGFAPDDTIRASKSRSRSVSPVQDIFFGINADTDADAEREEALSAGRPTTPLGSHDNDSESVEVPIYFDEKDDDFDADMTVQIIVVPYDVDAFPSVHKEDASLPPREQMQRPTTSRKVPRGPR